MKPIKFWTAKDGERPTIDINELALEMAKRFRCIDDAGNISCMMCRYRAGQLPSLLCAGCIDDWRRGRRVGA